MSIAIQSPVKAPARLSAGVWAFVMALGVAVLVRALSELNNDTSWLLTLNELWLGGARLDIDVIEVNPPASMLLFTLSVLLAQALKLTPEFTTNLLTFLIFLSVLAVAKRLQPAALAGLAPAILTLLLLALPLQVFAQREHVALMLMLPAGLAVAAELEGRKPALALRLALAVAAGVGICIKPHLVFAHAGLWLAYGLVSRSFLGMVLRWEHVATAAVAALYLAVILWAFPLFLTDTLPLVAEVYAAARIDLLPFLLDANQLGWVVGLMVVLVVLNGRIRQPLPAVLCAMAIGFQLANIAQGKGWLYHAFPAWITLLLLAILALRNLPEGEGSRIRAGALIALLGLSCTLIAYRSHTENVSLPDVRAAVLEVIRPGDSLMPLSHSIALGHPLVRKVGATWAGRVCSLWILQLAKAQLEEPDLAPERRARLETRLRQGVEMVREDLARLKPRIVVASRHQIEGPVVGAISADLKASYRHVRALPLGLDLWVRAE